MLVLQDNWVTKQLNIITKRLLGVNVMATDTFVPFGSWQGEAEHPSTSTSLMTTLVEPAWAGKTWLLEKSENGLRLRVPQSFHGVARTRLYGIRATAQLTRANTIANLYIILFRFATCAKWNVYMQKKKVTRRWGDGVISRDVIIRFWFMRSPVFGTRWRLAWR